MTIYYVRKTGNDGAVGTSPATAWATIGKALGAAGIASGDTVYIGAGVYREVVTIAIGASAETKIIGDVDGAQTGDAGEVQLTAYTTNDKTLPSSSSLVSMTTQNYLTFEKIVFVQGLDYVVGTTSGTNITFRDCSFIGNPAAGQIAIDYVQGSGPIAAHWLIERCLFLHVYGATSTIEIYLCQADVPDYDADFVVQNCLFIGGGYGWAVGVFPTQSGTGQGGGVILKNSTVIGANEAMRVFDGVGGSAFAVPCVVQNCFIYSGDSYAVQAQTLGEIVEDYNIISSGFPRSNVAAGAHSVSDGSYAPLLHFGQELQRGAVLRPFGTPTDNSPLLGFGNAANAPAVDVFNRIRPAGGQSISNAVGAYERHDTGAKEVTVVDSSPASVKIVGPGDHEFKIPVDAVATTISVKARYDANHAATNKPQAILLASPEIGVATETKTMTAAANTWETLTFAAQTPTAKGVITVRLISRAAAGNGIAYFDTFNIA